MADLPKFLRAALAAVLALCLSPVPGIAGCPTGESVAASLEKAFRKKVQVKRIQPSPVENLCEVVVSLQGRVSLLYTDASGRYFVTGQMVDAETRRDMSREALAEFNRFTPEEMEQLETLTALTYGESGPAVYFVTDPD